MCASASLVHSQMHEIKSKHDIVVELVQSSDDPTVVSAVEHAPEELHGDVPEGGRSPARQEHHVASLGKAEQDLITLHLCPRFEQRIEILALHF